MMIKGRDQRRLGPSVLESAVRSSTDIPFMAMLTLFIEFSGLFSRFLFRILFLMGTMEIWKLSQEAEEVLLWSYKFLDFFSFFSKGISEEL